MNIKLGSSEDLTITTKSGYTVTVPNSTGTLALTSQVPDTVSGTNDGTNWTSITIGQTTKAIPGGGSTTLSNLTDTTITTPTDGQVLTYDNATSKWINTTPTPAAKMIVWTNN